MIVTNNKNLANRCKLIRNHGEAVVENNEKSISNILVIILDLERLSQLLVSSN